MLGTSLKYYVRHPIQLGRALAADPVEAWLTARDRYVERQERQNGVRKYQSNPDWQRILHEQIGAKWPCTASIEFPQLWSEVIESLSQNGIQVGPMSFGAWNDGDAAFVRAIWCLIRHLSPDNVVETGVAHGVTSRFILEALQRNGKGHLWSIDLPVPDPSLRGQVGMAVAGPCKERWSLIEGSSRRRLAPLLAKLGRIDLFIHDSLHSERNVRFEMDRAWAKLTPNGAMVVDDVDANEGFRSFNKAFRSRISLVCEAEPVRPDLRRFNEKGLFGIVLKGQPEQESASTTNAKSQPGPI